MIFKWWGNGFGEPLGRLINVTLISRRRASAAEDNASAKEKMENLDNDSYGLLTGDYFSSSFCKPSTTGQNYDEKHVLGRRCWRSSLLVGNNNAN